MKKLQFLKWSLITGGRGYVSRLSDVAGLFRVFWVFGFLSGAVRKAHREARDRDEILEKGVFR